ncbi:50S ribosomal protein L25/general stress protein Ctc [Gordonia hydrophobica]|uniref:Large ribosomal subunit protein bL25 n=1 Tax=Gordonia hydrophobica TaxID=40516 RepID=A0ABZ2U323_9ACTN|nr:50S ribosomal protein L25/general stress protein Ctc [Gordonia hydrophobica]MBM7367290.1 large subunit ribosomal protein L25 [Gordonia hydrophobica]
MATAPQLATTARTEKGKGSARRARNAGQVPAVLYGHGTEPKHLLLPNRDLSAILRNNGVNAVVELDIDGDKQIALTKQVDVHPLRNYIEHVDLLIVKRGEKVIVEVNLLVEGTSKSGTLVVSEASTVEIEADALNIPEHIVISVEGLEAPTNITAGSLELPAGSTLVTDPEALLVAVEAQKASEEPADEEEEAEAEAAAE